MTMLLRRFREFVQDYKSCDNTIVPLLLSYFLGGPRRLGAYKQEIRNDVL